MSLRARLNLMIALAMLLIVGLGALFVAHNARRSVIDEARASVHLALELIDAGLSRDTNDHANLLDWLRDLSRLEKMRQLNIQLTDPRERAVHRVAPFSLKLPQAPGWFVWAVAPSPVTANKQTTGRDGRQLIVAVTANPADEIDEAWNEAQSFLTMMIVLAGAIALLVHITLGRAFKPMGVVLQRLKDIEEGNFSQRLPRFALPEFDRIAAAFNHMAEALEQARQENRRLSQRSLAIQEEERRHLARELHDELGQSIGAVRLMAASLRHTRDPDQTSTTINTILSVCDRVFDVVRAMMRRMRPLILDELGLLASLQDMADTWRVCNPATRLSLSCDPAVEDRIIPAAGIHIFRIVQEALTNIAKHAAATEANIRLASDPNRIILELGDNGIGFDPHTPTEGFGLHGLRERVANLQGTFQLTAAPGCGVQIHIDIPCQPSHD